MTFYTKNYGGTRLESQPKGPSRRAVLRGIGASLALPWLETFNAPVWGQMSEPPKRFIAFYTPNGFNMSQFWISYQ